MRLRRPLRTVLALTHVLWFTGCPEDDDVPPGGAGGTGNHQFECSFSYGPGQFENYIIGYPCIDGDHANMPHNPEICACEKLCEDLKAGAPQGDLIHGIDCATDVDIENVTDPYIACEPDLNWEQQCPAPFEESPTYRCHGPVIASCDTPDNNGDGLPDSTHGVNITHVDICRQPDENLNEVHDRCRDECEGMIAAAEAQIDDACDIPEALCIALQFPVAVEGDGTCVLPTEDSAPKDGFYLQRLAWSVGDGRAASRPLACDYRGGCCHSYGKLACANITHGQQTKQSAATRRNTLTGTLTVRQGEVILGKLRVNASIDYAARACGNIHGACPLYVEQLRVSSVSGQNLPHGKHTIRLEESSATLARPFMAVFDERTGAVKLPRGEALVAVVAKAFVNSAQLPLSQVSVLNDTLNGHFDARRGIVALSGRVEDRSKKGFSVELSLGAPVAPGETLRTPTKLKAPTRSSSRRPDSHGLPFRHAANKSVVEHTLALPTH